VSEQQPILLAAAGHGGRKIMYLDPAMLILSPLWHSLIKRFARIHDLKGMH